MLSGFRIQEIREIEMGYGAAATMPVRPQLSPPKRSTTLWLLLGLSRQNFSASASGKRSAPLWLMIMMMMMLMLMLIIDDDNDD